MRIGFVRWAAAFAAAGSLVGGFAVGQAAAAGNAAPVVSSKAMTVRYEDVYAYTQSMVLRSTSGTMRIVDAYHPIDKLRAKGLLPEQVAIH